MVHLSDGWEEILVSILGSLMIGSLWYFSQVRIKSSKTALKIGQRRWKERAVFFVLFFWTWLGPDLPKIFKLYHKNLLHQTEFIFAGLGVTFLFLSIQAIYQKTQALNYTLFVYIGLVSHCLIDRLFS